MPAAVVYVLVFVLPFVECSLFVGFLFPGETALVLAGVLSSGAFADGSRPSLLLLCVLAVLGAVIGDTVGWAVGRRYGPAVQQSRPGRLVGERRWQVAEAFLQRRGGPAVLLGRFTAVLRALVPSAAGMAAVPLRTFLVWNALGGLIWATGFGARPATWPARRTTRVEGWLGRGALVVTGVVVVAAVAVHLVRRRRHGARRRASCRLAPHQRPVRALSTASGGGTRGRGAQHPRAEAHRPVPPSASSSSPVMPPSGPTTSTTSPSAGSATRSAARRRPRAAPARSAARSRARHLRGGVAARAPAAPRRGATAWPASRAVARQRSSAARRARPSTA